ncbi:MAG: ATP-binding protein [Desulfobulbus sp.]|nr:ATP-binding protein [Desulfobulbus sp.]
METNKFPPWSMIALVVALIILGGGGVWFFKIEKVAGWELAEKQHAAIAHLKVDQIVRWRTEWLSDASIITDSPFLNRCVALFLREPKGVHAEDLRKYFRSLRTHYRYSDVLLVDPAGQVLLSLNQTIHGDGYMLALAAAFRERKPVFTDLHINVHHLTPHISVVAPIFSDEGPTGSRTPLNSIIGFTGILLQGLAGPLNPEQHKQMSMVQKSSRHLLALINDVLDISKIEAGQLDLANTSFPLTPSIEKIVKLIVPLAEQKGINLEMDIAPEVATIVADQRRLEQVILNLLGNAVKFTEKEGVRIACQVENDQYLLSFFDTGIGMHPEELPNLFQPFHQINLGLARKHEGTGLGLSFCKKPIDLMGGSIDVASQWGQGSTFTSRLPRQPGETV